MNSVRKTAWLLKHARVEKFALFKIGHEIEQLAEQLRDEIDPRYRPRGKVSLINFLPNIVDLTIERKIERVQHEWYTETKL